MLTFTTQDKINKLKEWGYTVRKIKQPTMFRGNIKFNAYIKPGENFSYYFPENYTLDYAFNRELSERLLKIL